MQVQALLNHYHDRSPIHALLNPEPTPKRFRTTTSVVLRWPVEDLPFRSGVGVKRRLEKSRLVGLKHRAAEQKKSASLAGQVDRLRAENERLQQLVEAPQINVSVGQRVDERTARIIGTNRISGECALVLLELIAIRRNLDRPAMVLECPTKSQVDDAVSMITEQAKFLELRWIHERWARHEVGFVRGYEEAGRWDKKCRRCGRIKVAGSGHARSFCDDGMCIDSGIPYRW